MKGLIYAIRDRIHSLFDDKDEHTCSSNGYNSSSSANYHFISMLLVQKAGAQQDKHRGRDAHSSANRSIYIHSDPAYTSSRGRDR